MIERDKALHAVGGALASIAVIVLVNVASWVGIGWACLLGSVLVGIGYEAQQYLRKDGTVSMHDALATAAGGALVAVIAWLVPW